MTEQMHSKDKSTCLKEENGFPCFIPAQKVLNLISRKWGIQLIYLLGKEKKMRYNELKEKLHRGWSKNRISDATLSTRLSEFTEEGLVIREVFPEIPPKVEYFLSEKGENLSKALVPLIEWAINSCHATEST